MNIVLELASFSPILPAIIGLCKLKDLDKPHKLILLYVALSFTSEIIDYVVIKSDISTLPLFHLFTIIEFVLLVEFYKRFSSKKFEQILMLTQFAFIGFAVVNAIFFQSVTEHNTIPKLIGGIGLILMSLKFFYDSFEIKKNEGRKDISFYINTGVFFYFSISITTISLENYLLNVSDALYYGVWTIQWIANILFYFLLAIGLWTHKTK